MASLITKNHFLNAGPNDDLNDIGTETNGNTADFFLIYDVSANAFKKITWANVDSNIGGGGLAYDGSTTNGLLTYKDADEIKVHSNATYNGGQLILNLDSTHTSGVSHPPVLDIDMDKTGISADGATFTFLAGARIKVDDSATNHANSTVNMTGLIVDIESANATGTLTNIGLDIDVTGADNNYAALFRNGKIGVVTTTPRSPLHIKGDASGWDKALTIENHDTTDYAQILVDSDGLKFRTFSNGDHFYFRDNGNNTTMRIEDGGNVAVGANVSAPSFPFEVQKANYNASGAEFNATLALLDDTAIAAGVGGMIMFGGRHGSTSTKSWWAKIGGVKSNATNFGDASDNAAKYGDLTFHTRGAAPTANKPMERMRILHDGKVGIGLSAPGNLLHIAQPGSTSTHATLLKLDNGIDADGGRGVGMDFRVRFTSGNIHTSQIYFDFYGDKWTDSIGMNYVSGRSGSFSHHYFREQGGGVQLMIADDGDVGVGSFTHAAQPDAKLHVKGAGGGEQILLEDTSSDSNPAIEIKNDARHWKLQARGGDSDKFRIAEGSNVWATIDTSGNFIAESQRVAWTASGNTNTEDGANTWAKVCTFDPGGGQYKDCNLILGVANSNSSNTAAAIISVKFRSNAHTSPYNMDVAYIAKTGAVELDEDSFKIFSAGGAGNNCVNTMELWVNKVSTWSGFDFYEITKRTNLSSGLTYHTNSAWQSATPTNTTQTAVTDGIELGLNTKIPDNRKLYIGTGKDLEIYHDANDSFIKDTGTGSLKIDSSRVRLYHGGNEELYTYSGGIVVTGDLIVDGEGTTSSNIQFNRAIDAFIKVDTMTGTDDDGKNLTLQAGRGTGTGSGGDIFFQTAAAGGTSNSTANAATNKMVILNTGLVGIGTDAPSHKLHITSPPDASNDYAIYADEGNDNYVGLVNRHSSNRRTALFYRNIHADYTAQPMVEMHNDHASDDQDVLKITQDGLGNAIQAKGSINLDTGYSYRFRDRADLGMFESSYHIAVKAPENIYMMVDSNNNGNNDRGFYIQKNGSGMGNGTELFRVVEDGTCVVTGAFSATTKSFDIEHPTKEGMRLHHGSLEGPEHAVYIRGKGNSATIHLPDYWTGLVDEDTITVQLTAIGHPQDLYVRGIKNGKVRVAAKARNKMLNYFYFIQAERKDVSKMVVEYDG